MKIMGEKKGRKRWALQTQPPPPPKKKGNKRQVAYFKKIK